MMSPVLRDPTADFSIPVQGRTEMIESGAMSHPIESFDLPQITVIDGQVDDDLQPRHPDRAATRNSGHFARPRPVSDTPDGFLKFREPFNGLARVGGNAPRREGRVIYGGRPKTSRKRLPDTPDFLRRLEMLVSQAPFFKQVLKQIPSQLCNGLRRRRDRRFFSRGI